VHLGVASAPAAPTPASPAPPPGTSAIDAAESTLKEAARLYRAREFRAAGDAVRKVQETLAKSVKDDARLSGRTAKLYRQLAKAHALLELEGVKLPALKVPRPPQKAGAAPAVSRVSFVKQVAPILVGRCGECHVTGIRGKFSMANFAALSKGARKGPVVLAGNSQQSPLIEIIRSGNMPRNGGKLAPGELETIARWIDEGAKFDGSDPNAPLVNPIALTGPTSRPDIAVVAATGKEEALFARDVGPALLANCMGCHSTRLTLGDLRLDTFARLLRGGLSGVIVVPGRPDESLLIRKLRGQAGARMPMGRPPLPDATIEKIAKWIALGARYDAYDPNQPLSEVVAMSRAANANHTELAQLRAELAAKNWRMMLPDAEATKSETENFLLYGNVGPRTLSEVGQLAEKQVPVLRRLLRAPPGQPLIKGRMTIFVFDKRYDYSEIGPMVEQREIPSEWRGHWRYTFVDAYGCVLPPSAAKEYSLPVLVGQQVAGVYVASLGRVPRWFAEGSARAIAARLDAKDSRVRAWDAHLEELTGSPGTAMRFLANALPPEDSDVVSYGFMKYLMASSSRYQATLASIRSGVPFDQAFAKSFGTTAEQAVAAWGARSTARAGR